jgi:1-phosphofructokinase
MLNILTITLNPSIDHILMIDKVTLYKKNLLSDSQIFYGGKGINVAFTLGKLGAPATAAGLMCDQDLNGFIEKLSSVNVNSNFTKINGKTRSAYKLMETKSNRDTEFNQAGSKIKPEDLEHLKFDLEHLLTHHAWVALCGSVPAGVSIDIYVSLIKMCKRSGVLTCLDSSGEALIMGIQALPDILRINQSELGEILARKILDKQEIIEAIKTLQATGISKVIVSMGAEGTLGFDGEKMIQVQVPKVNIKGLTGAGDAMTAGLLASLCEGKSFKESLRYSNAVATASTLKFEPGDFDQSDLEQILINTAVKEIN